MSISSKNQTQQTRNQNSQSHFQDTLKMDHQMKSQSLPIFDQGKLHEYFHSIQANLDTCFDNGLKKQVEENVYKQIQAGATAVFLTNKKNDLSNKRDIIKTLEFLELQTSVLHKNKMNPETLQQQIPCNILTKEQHSRYVSQMFEKRKQSDMKHEQMVSKLNKDRINECERVKKQEMQSIQKQKQMRRQRIKVNLEQKRIKHELALQFQIKTAQQYKNILGKQFLHQKMEQKYNNEIVLPQLEQKKKRLKQIRQISKAFNIKDISRHEKEYEGKRNKSYSERSKKNEDWIYKPPQKTDRLIKILKEEEETIEQRKEQRKRKIQWKMERVQSYSSYLKQNFVPKINEEKQKQIQQRIASLQPNRKQSLSQRKQIGLQYLKQMKQLGKKSLSRVSTQKKSSFSYQSSDKQSNDYLSSHRKHESFYQEKRINRISNILESEGKSSTQKIKELKTDSQKLREAYNRREELKRLEKKNNSDVVDNNIDLLLGEIHAKMGIINIYNQMGENAQ